MLEEFSEDIIRAARLCNGAVILLVATALIGGVVIVSRRWRTPLADRALAIFAFIPCVGHLVLGTNLAYTSHKLTTWLNDAPEAVNSFGSPIERQAIRLHDSLRTLAGLSGTTPLVTVTQYGESGVPTIEFDLSVAGYSRAFVMTLAGGALGWLIARRLLDGRSVPGQFALASMVGGLTLAVSSWYGFEIRGIMAAEHVHDALSARSE